ncbi:hypothetical protein ABZ299_00520, partial [Streptomyces sp. NPDC006184]
SAMVYGALPDNELPLSEDAELRATAEATGRLGVRASARREGEHVQVAVARERDTPDRLARRTRYGLAANTYVATGSLSAPATSRYAFLATTSAAVG